MLSRNSAFAGALLSLVLSAPAFADGTVTLDFGGDTQDIFYRLRVGSDGRIYALVNSDIAGDRCGIFALDPSGTLISTFGTGGRLALSAGLCVADLLPRSDGSVLLANRDTSITTRDATGTPIFTTVTSPSPGVPFTIALQADGKLLLAGRRNQIGNNVHPPWKIWRWNTDGTVDASFSGGAVEYAVPNISINGTYPYADSIIPLPGGKLLVAGVGSTQGREPYLTRFNGDGTTDFTFGTNGLYQAAGSNRFDGAIAVDSSGQIYLPNASTQDLNRLTPDGALDSSFSTQSTPTARSVHGLKLDSSERPVVVSVESKKLHLAKYTTSGALDPSFAGGNGQMIYDLPRPLLSTDPYSPHCELALQTGDKLIVACNVEGAGESFSDVTFARFNADGSLDTTFGAAQEDSDVYPDDFSFTPNTATYNKANVQSNTVTVTGINGPTTVMIKDRDTDSAFSVGCTGTFTAERTIIESGQTLCVRHHASPTPNGTATTQVYVGGRVVPYATASTNVAADTQPDAFSFTSQTNVPRRSSITSNTITVSGIDGVAPITVQNGHYLIDCDREKNSSQINGTVVNGQKLCALQGTPIQGSTTTTTTVAIGGVSATFTSTTEADDLTPDAFSFVDQSGVALSTVVTSNSVTISGIDAITNVSITGGEYSIGCGNGNPWISGTGTLSPGNPFCVRHTSASTAGATVTTTITIGGVSAAFRSTTAAAASPPPSSGSSSGYGGGGAMDFLSLIYMSLLAALSICARPIKLRRTH